MLRLKRVLLSLLALVLATFVGLAIWWFWSPTLRWQDRHGDLAAVSRVELSTEPDRVAEQLRGVSTSGLAVELTFQWELKPGPSQTFTPVAIFVGDLETNHSWPTWVPRRAGEAWVVVQSPIDQAVGSMLDQRWDAFDGAPAVALALDVLARRLTELGAPPLGSVVVVGSRTEEALAAQAAAYDPRVTDAILVESPGDEAVWSRLMRRSGSLALDRSLRRFEARAGSVVRLQGGAFREIERTASNILAESRAPH